MNITVYLPLQWCCGGNRNNGGWDGFWHTVGRIELNSLVFTTGFILYKGWVSVCVWIFGRIYDGVVFAMKMLQIELFQRGRLKPCVYGHISNLPNAQCKKQNVNYICSSLLDMQRKWSYIESMYETTIKFRSPIKHRLSSLHLET